VQLLEQTFWEEDVTLIRSLPGHADMGDILGWHFDNKGWFSVKSAYKVHWAATLRAQRMNKPGGDEGIHGKDDIWKHLWKIDCPPKVKHFLWRMSHNSLAVRTVLQRRGMKIDTRCCMCGRFDEDGGHLLLKCKEVKEVWRELNLEEI
jgi:hypothetical protein